MARNNSTFQRGNQAAVKHGGYARGRLADQTAILEEAKRRMKAGELAPVLESIAKALQITEAMLDETYAWLNKNGGPLTPRGRVKPATTLVDRLLVHYASQAATLYRLMAATHPDVQAMTQEQAERFLGDRYRADAVVPSVLPSPASSDPASGQTG